MKTRLSEKAFQQQVLDLAKLLGWRVAHFRSVPVMHPGGRITYQTPVQGQGVGFPDLLLIRGGRLLVAELKVPPNKTTPEQDEWLVAFRRAGIEAFVWTPDCWNRIQALLEAS